VFVPVRLAGTAEPVGVLATLVCVGHVARKPSTTLLCAAPRGCASTLAAVGRLCDSQFQRA
jgi:hypothetical protein